MLPDSTIVDSVGMYTSYLNRLNGCDSTIITNLAFYQKFYYVYDTICDNEMYLLPDNSLVNIQGAYTDTLISSHNCDSIITSYLTVKTTTSSYIYDTICVNDFYITPSGKILNIAGVYLDTIPNSRNCDSVISIDLFVLPISTTNIYDTICANEYYTLSNGNMVNLQGVYTVNQLNSVNCDSVINTYLTVLPNYLIEYYDTICSNDVFTLPNGNFTSTAGIYYDTLVNVYGCDTVIASNLMVEPIIATYILDTICEYESYVLPDSVIVNTSGVFFSTLSRVNGCDSIIVTNIFVIEAEIEIYDTICSDEIYILPSGNTTNIAGVYNDTISGSSFCDSIITTNLTVFSIDTSLTVSIDTLFANQSNANYQWFDCGNNTIIPNETSNLFIPTANGSYAVILDNYYCTDTSNCHTISIISLSEENISNNITVYPNPTNNNVNIDLSKKYNDVNVKVFNSQGQLLINRDYYDKQSLNIDLNQISSGVLHININADGINSNVKVVKM